MFYETYTDLDTTNDENIIYVILSVSEGSICDISERDPSLRSG